MNAAAFVGRLGPLAAALGIGAAVLLGGAGIAGAESDDTDSAASATVDRSTPTAGRAASRGRGPIRPGPARPAAAASSPAAAGVSVDRATVRQRVPRVAVKLASVDDASGEVTLLDWHVPMGATQVQHDAIGR